MKIEKKKHKITIENIHIKQFNNLLVVIIVKQVFFIKKINLMSDHFYFAILQKFISSSKDFFFVQARLPVISFRTRRKKRTI